ncbi:DDB1- and CUL4-associated factor 10 homolog isoform X2 [Lycorma delicatula]|uniref:DDB1- and CUL4-associated factor 10 homolog isoform X2 n=1 Tax=Lycorma delicatula TaxID=130591 RepID=UPI003F513A12
MMDKVKYNSGVFNNTWLRQREIGLKPKLGSQDRFMKGLYTTILPCTSWDHSESIRSGVPGGIFNLEFSPDGSLLVAACEKKSILMFDPLSRQLVHAVDNAHEDCVNCVRFLDSRVFATCSDDSTVALWDARHLKNRIRTLLGHSNWVKNIEFSQSDSLLVTSGFDGKIYTWDINSYTENGFVYNEVFHTNGLMRTRLNPDASKMIICTTGGYLILIHDLDLKTLGQDLAGFKPNVYRLMQVSRSTIPVAASYTHLFSHKRKTNRLEFVTDFPQGDDAEVVSSLQVHPHGWCALSRNISHHEVSEWTCVHDIQDRELSDCDADSELSDDEGNGSSEDRDCFIETEQQSTPAVVVNPGEEISIQIPSQREREQERERANRRAQSASGSSSFFRGFPISSRGDIPPLTSTDVWEALVAIREVRSQRERERAEAERRQNGVEMASNLDMETRMRIVRMSSGLPEAREVFGERRERRERRRRADTDSDDSSRERDRDEEQSNGDDTEAPRAVTSIVIRRSPRRRDGTRERNQDAEPGTTQQRDRNTRRPLSEYEATLAHMAGRTVVILGSSRNRMPHVMVRPTTCVKVPKNHRIHQNIPRLTHFIEEPNVGKGFIKELCFSADGRLICSPFGYGVRFLSFSPECSELSTCVPKGEAVKLYELGTNVCHRDIVVSTKFSPKHCLLVSGCLNGRICWHQPVI